MQLEDARILVADDAPLNLELVQAMLAGSGYRNVETTTESAAVADLCAGSDFDLLLIDLHMPSPNGIEVLRDLRGRPGSRWMPVVVLTADISPAIKREALSAGASDFLTKPFDRAELQLRIDNLLRSRFLQRELETRNDSLEEAVRVRTSELEEARLETLRRLAAVAEFRDDETGSHVQRVGATSGQIARELGVDGEEAESIALAATLHDLGKVGIPDALLLKPGRFTPQEYESMKVHVGLGARMLRGSTSRVLQLAEEIATSHHERWDGSGYPLGLAGREIPLTGRIVAVADVFDALTHDRPYKPAWAVPEAVAEVRRCAGTAFDPAVVEAFDQLDHSTLVRVPAEAAAPALRD